MTRDERWHLYCAAVFGAIIGRHSFWIGEDGVVTSDTVDRDQMELAAKTAVQAADRMEIFLDTLVHRRA